MIGLLNFHRFIISNLDNADKTYNSNTKLNVEGNCTLDTDGRIEPVPMQKQLCDINKHQYNYKLL